MKFNDSQCFFSVDPLPPQTHLFLQPLKGIQLLTITETAFTCTHTSISYVYQGLCSYAQPFYSHIQAA